MIQRLGKYRIIERIGRGGMGTVYKAHDPMLDRTVALKVISSDVDVTDELRTRFFREAQACARLSHPNVITVYDMGEEGGHLFIVMEFLEGEELRQLITQKRNVFLEDKLSMMIEVCDGLDYAHKRGIIHRDIKPGNIFVQRDGHVKLLDFGIARIATADAGLTRTGLIMGTLRYMSPEQARGRVDLRSDIFSVGAVFYELLTYRHAFPGEDPMEILDRLRSEDPVPLVEIDGTLPSRLSEVVARSLQKDPAQRFSELAQMRDELEQLRRGLMEEATALRGRVRARFEQIRALQRTLTEVLGRSFDDETVPLVDDRVRLVGLAALEQEAASKIDHLDQLVVRAEALEPELEGARQALESGRFDDAISALERIVGDLPDHVHAATELERARSLQAAAIREAEERARREAEERARREAEERARREAEERARREAEERARREAEERARREAEERARHEAEERARREAEERARHEAEERARREAEERTRREAEERARREAEERARREAEERARLEAEERARREAEERARQDAERRVTAMAGAKQQAEAAAATRYAAQDWTRAEAAATKARAAFERQAWAESAAASDEAVAAYQQSVEVAHQTRSNEERGEALATRERATAARARAEEARSARYAASAWTLAQGQERDAATAFERGDYPAAARGFTTAAQTYAEAASEAAGAIERENQRLAALLAEAQALFERRRWTESLERLAEMLRISPDHAEAGEWQGRVAQARAAEEQAQREAEERARREADDRARAESERHVAAIAPARARAEAAHAARHAAKEWGKAEAAARQARAALDRRAWADTQARSNEAIAAYGRAAEESRAVVLTTQRAAADDARKQAATARKKAEQAGAPRGAATEWAAAEAQEQTAAAAYAREEYEAATQASGDAAQQYGHSATVAREAAAAEAEARRETERRRRQAAAATDKRGADVVGTEPDAVPTGVDAHAMDRTAGPRDEPRASARRSRLVPMGIGLGAAAVVVVASVVYWQSSSSTRPTSDTPGPAVSQPAVTMTPPRTVESAPKATPVPPASKAESDAVEALRKQVVTQREAAVKAGAERGAKAAFEAALAKERAADTAFKEREWAQARARYDEARAGYESAADEATRQAAIAHATASATRSQEQMTTARRSADRAGAAKLAQAHWTKAQDAQRGAEAAFKAKDFEKAERLFADSAKGYREAEQAAAEQKAAESERARLAAVRQQLQAAEEAGVAAANARRNAERATAGRYAARTFAAAQQKEEEGRRGLERQQYESAEARFREAARDYQAALGEAQRAADAERQQVAARQRQQEAELAAARRSTEQMRARAAADREQALRAGAEALAKDLLAAAAGRESDGDRLVAAQDLSAARAAYQDAAERYSEAGRRARAAQEAKAAAAEQARVAAARPAERPPERGPVPADEIRNVLNSYAQAFQTKDIALLQKVRPGLKADEIRKIRDSFDQSREYRMTLKVESMDVTGDQAVVRGQRLDSLVSRSGQAFRNESAFTFRLRRTADGWVIDATN